MEDDLGPRLLDLLRGGSEHFSACVKLVREPRFALRLLPLVQRALAAHGPAEEEGPLLLACQLLQRGCRRCPLDECPNASSVHEALRVACSLGKTAVATQLALGAAVLVLRSPAWEPDRLLQGIGAALLPSDSAGTAAAGGYSALVLALTLLAEELHAPAAKISVPPDRTVAVRASLRRNGASLLATLHDWCCHNDSTLMDAALRNTSLAAALRCSAAWCTAGLISPTAYAEGTILTSRACQCLAATPATNEALAELAAEALNAALAASLVGGSIDCDSVLLLCTYARTIHDGLASHALTRHIASVVCTACMVLAHQLLSFGSSSADALSVAAAVASELNKWVALLVQSVVTLPLSDAGGARGCWIELHDLCNETPFDDKASTAGSAQATLDALLAPFRAGVLNGILCGGGALPSNFEVLSLEDRAAVEEAREDCRALLRGTIFVREEATHAAIDALRQHAASLVEGAASTSSEELEGRVRALEATLHALSAAAKPLGRHQGCAPLSEALSQLIPPTAELSKSFMASGIGLGRGLLCALLIWIGSLATWLGGPGREPIVACVLPVVLASLDVSEEERTGVWGLRSKQEHAGAVAIMKLCAAAPAAVLAACSLDQLLEALHASAGRPSDVLAGLSSRSSALLLVAAADLVTHASSVEHVPTSQLVQWLFGPPLTQLEHASHGNGDALLDAARAARRLATLLPRLPPSLQPAAAELMKPWAPAFIHLLGRGHEEAAAAACAVITALCVGCGAHAAPLVPAFAAAAWPFFQTHPHDALKLADAIVRCAARASVGGAATSAAAAELVNRLATAMTVVHNHTSMDDLLEEQTVRAEWFGVLSAWASVGSLDGANGGGDGKIVEAEWAMGLAASLAPSLPLLLMALWQVAHLRPPPEALETQQGVLALKQGLHLLQRALPSSPVGSAILGALRGSPSSSATGNAHAASVKPPASELVETLLLGLGSWYPSWILSDVVGALWALRQANEADFSSWLHLALATDGVPRHGITPEQKAAYARQLTVEAKSKSAFKASLKQCCGGKKKNTAGTPPV